MTSDHPLSEPFVIESEAPPFEFKPCYVIGSRSYLADRAVPLPEIIVLPGRSLFGGRVTWSYDGQRGQIEASGSWRRKLYEAMRPIHQIALGVPVYDLRPFGPTNWSHALNVAFPLALMIRDRLQEQGLREPLLIFPARISNKTIELFTHFGFDCLCTNGRVEGELIISDSSDPSFLCIHHYRDWFKPHVQNLQQLVEAGRDGLPDKVFLDRRDGRCLANGDAVRKFLSERGFTIVYPENLSLAGQCALLCTASEIVAIHGAGIAPLMFRQPENGPLRFVELLSPGHMARYFEIFTRDLPGDYRAIRGRPGAKMSAAANNLETRFADYTRNFSLAPFEIDLTSLDLALRPESIEELLDAGPLEYRDL